MQIWPTAVCSRSSHSQSWTETRDPDTSPELRISQSCGIVRHLPQIWRQRCSFLPSWENSKSILETFDDVFVCLLCACSRNHWFYFWYPQPDEPKGARLTNNRMNSGQPLCIPRYRASWRLCTAAVMPTAKQYGAALITHAPVTNSGCCLIALHYWRLTRPLLRFFPHAQRTV